MATLEKPKQKKPKKTLKSESKILELKNDETITKEDKQDELTTQKEIQIQSCSTEQSGSGEDVTEERERHNTLEKQFTMKVDDSTINLKSYIKSQQKIEEKTNDPISVICDKIQEVTVTPSAPIFNETEPVQYPELPQRETSKVCQPKTYAVTLKPFTKEELAQLYSNSELEASKEFETCFVQSELRPGALAKHPLHKLISNYAIAKEKLHNNQIELERLRKELKSCEESAWIIDNASVTSTAECQDGVTLQTTHHFLTSRLQKHVMDEINRLQTQIYRLANDVHLSSSYEVSSTRVIIEYYIERTLPVKERSELRASLSVLFRWARVTGPVCEEARNWLGSVVAALLPDADWQDHAYILCHVLRCPAGIAKWAAAYVQVLLPLTNDDAFEDQHINHAVCVLGMLLRGTAARREFLTIETTQNTDPWVVVDSDGEEDADAPFGLRENDLVALLNQVPIGEIFARILALNTTMNEHRLLRIFAFCRVVIDLLNDGLITYSDSTTRYHQFCKRLSRLMGHVLRHACDAHELWRTVESSPDIRARLQVELDELFLRCANWLYAAERLGAWQFLAVLPFEALSTPAIWRFCHLLDNTDSPQAFEEHLIALSVEASYYLLNTYANMASCVLDGELCSYVTLRLLNVGFMCEGTRDTCAKSAAVLLGTACTKRPVLISIIVRTAVEQLAHIGPPAAQLFRELPIAQWQPSDDDLELLGRLLLDNEPQSLEGCVARAALLDLNWGVLPWHIHNRTALLVARHCVQYGDTPWAWQLVHRLQLHISDRATDQSDVRHIPDLAQLPELFAGVRANRPLCNYLALLMTQHGHLVPMVCTHGITQLQLLVQAGRHEAAVLALGRLVPLFADCSPDTLANSRPLQQCFQQILKNAHLLPSAIEHCMLHARWRELLVTWIHILLAQPQWHKDTYVRQLLDSCVRISFFDEQAYMTVSGVFREILRRRCEESDTGEGGSSSLLSWMPGSSNSWPPILIQSAAAECAWLAYVCLDAEHDILEKRTHLWPELLHQLRQQNGKTNVDACIRRACSACKIPSSTSTALCIYRWAQLALDVSHDHPLLPCIWQAFFHMYLERGKEGEQPVCVGGKFFDGVINTTFLKKLKRRLQETAQVETNERKAGVYRAYSLWLDEPLLRDGSLYLPSLPVQYEPRYLALALEGEWKPWRELCDAEAVRKVREMAGKGWKKALGREQPKPITATVLKVETPLARIQRRIHEHDKPLPAPVMLRKMVNPIPDLRISNEQVLTADVQRYIKQLSQHAELYALQCAEHKALDKQFRDLLPHLYTMCRTTKLLTKTCGPSCSRNASFALVFTEARANDAIRQQLQKNRTNVQALLSRSAGQPVTEVVVTLCAVIAHGASMLEITSNANLKPLGAELFFLLVNMYGDQLDSYPPARHLFNTCCNSLGPLATSSTHCARLCRIILGTERFPAVSRLVVSHFHPPPNVSTVDFLQMYGDLVDSNTKIANGLLAKLDVPSWLNIKPRLVDRSKFIHFTFKALNIVEELARRHLIYVFTHEFPEHYGEVLQLALIWSGEGKLPKVVWRDIIAALARPTELQFSNEGQLLSDQQLRHAVAQQHTLRQDVLVDTCALLGRYFGEERRKHGATFGLYPRYGKYTSELAAFYSLVSHALVWQVVCGSGAPADRLVECTYARLVEMYGPWLLPGSAEEQPWSRDDSSRARLMLGSLISCVSFMLDAMPASRAALCQTWQLYCNMWARQDIHEHILRVVNEELARLPWYRHWPSVQDLETMARLICVIQLPACHAFTCHVLLLVDWPAWLARLSPQHVLRAHQCLLQLLVRLPEDKETHDHACRLLGQAYQWRWSVLTLPDLSNACDWCVTSLDPRVALLESHGDLEIHRAVLKLLASISYYENDTNELPCEVITARRHYYLRTCVRLIAGCAGRHKQLVTQQQPQLITRTLTHHLDFLEQRITDINQCDILMTELLQLLNCVALSEATTSCVETWLSTRSPTSNIITCISRTCLRSIQNSEQAGRLCEAALTAYFTEEGSNPSWETVWREVKPGTPRQPPIEQQLCTAGRLLTIHALILRRFEAASDLQVLLDTLVDISIDIKIVEGIEPKLPLLWRDVLKAAQLALDAERTIIALRRWATHLTTMADSKPGTLRSVFSALTGSLNKQAGQLTPQGRLLCRAIAAYTLAQLSSVGLRLNANTPCHVGSPGGNTECPRVLLRIDAGLPDDLRHLAEYALKRVQDPQNSLHNAIEFLGDMASRLYPGKPYLANH